VSPKKKCPKDGKQQKVTANPRQQEIGHVSNDQGRE
jgi:hypothetical protein